MGTGRLCLQTQSRTVWSMVVPGSTNTKYYRCPHLLVVSHPIGRQSLPKVVQIPEISFYVTLTLLGASQYGRGLYCRIMCEGQAEKAGAVRRLEEARARWESHRVQRCRAIGSLLTAKLQSCIPMSRLTHSAPLQPRCVCVSAGLCECICACMCACVSVYVFWR